MVGLPAGPCPRPPNEPDRSNRPAAPGVNEPRGAKRRPDSPPNCLSRRDNCRGRRSRVRLPAQRSAAGARPDPGDNSAALFRRECRCVSSPSEPPAPRAVPALRRCRLRVRATRSRRRARAPRAMTSSMAPARRSARDRQGPGLPAAAQSAGSCRARCGSARSAARHAAFWPALSPSKQRIGSSAIFHNSASWFSVSAVPSGATLAGYPRRPWR